MNLMDYLLQLEIYNHRTFLRELLPKRITVTNISTSSEAYMLQYVIINIVMIDKLTYILHALYKILCHQLGSIFLLVLLVNLYFNLYYEA